jgi:hypothetical protein
MSTIPALRNHALRQPIDFDRYKVLRENAQREYRISLTAWCTAEVWVKGIDEHDAIEAAQLLWGVYDQAFTHTDGGIHAMSVLDTRKAQNPVIEALKRPAKTAA